jgi:transposase
MLFETRGLRVFVFTEAIDMRSGFDRLLYYARDKMRARIDQGHVYLFFGKNRRRLKAIYFDGTGLVLVAKRMERGHFMAIRDVDRGEITVSDLRLIFHGSVIRRPTLERSMTPRESVALPVGIRKSIDDGQSTSPS